MIIGYIKKPRASNLTNQRFAQGRDCWNCGWPGTMPYEPKAGTEPVRAGRHMCGHAATALSLLIRLDKE